MFDTELYFVFNVLSGHFVLHRIIELQLSRFFSINSFRRHPWWVRFFLWCNEHLNEVFERNSHFSLIGNRCSNLKLMHIFLLIFMWFVRILCIPKIVNSIRKILLLLLSFSTTSRMIVNLSVFHLKKKNKNYLRFSESKQIQTANKQLPAVKMLNVKCGHFLLPIHRCQWQWGSITKWLKFNYSISFNFIYVFIENVVWICQTNLTIFGPVCHAHNERSMWMRISISIFEMQ